MDVQNAFFQDMYALKIQLFYLNEYINYSEKFKTYLNYFTAVVSSTSIAAWAIWKSFTWLWPCLIALSQVIAALKPHLPFDKRVKFLGEFHLELTLLFSEYEFEWVNVFNGSMTENEINKKLRSLRQKSTSIKGKYLSNNHLPRKIKFEGIAEERATQYFNNYYDL